MWATLIESSRSMPRTRLLLSCSALAELADAPASRPAALCSLSDDELSPAALATRVVLADCARALVQSGTWVGATLTQAPA